MTAFTAVSAEGEAGIEAWVKYPRRGLYPRDSNWVPPLDADLVRALDTAKNPFFQHGVAQPLLAVDAQGRIGGRILAHVWWRHNVRHAERAAFFGYFECRDEPEAAQALISAARAFGATRGCTVLRGPFNMTAMQEMGVVTDGFAEPPAIDESYTPAYYPSLLEKCGLTAVFPVTTFRVDDLAKQDPNALVRPRHRELQSSGRLRIRPADAKHLDDELEILRELLNDSFYDNSYFVAITRDEWRFQVGPLKRVLDPAISLVAELDGVPVGFAVTLPDFNQLLKRMRGQLGVRGALTFLLGRRRVHDASLIIIGVQRQLQGQGIMRVLQAELLRALQRRGYRRLTVTWIADENAKSLATVRAIGGRPLHRLTLYEGPIEPVETNG